MIILKDMATQWLVTVRVDDEVEMKIVAWSNWYNAENVATRIKESWPVSAQEAYDIAIEEHLGWISTLVVTTLEKTIYENEEGDLDGHPLYKKTFADPNFNPRWEHWTSDYTEIIDIVTKKTED